MNAAQAVLRLEEIARDHATDPERAHSLTDDVLLAYVPVRVREAYEAVQAACSWWATA